MKNVRATGQGQFYVPPVSGFAGNPELLDKPTDGGLEKVLVKIKSKKMRLRVYRDLLDLLNNPGSLSRG